MTVRPLTEGYVRKGGHNSGPSQIKTRPAPPAPSKPVTLARATFPSAFALADRVTIDGDESIKATVIGTIFRHTGQEIEIAWMANGAHQTAWAAAWRLKLVE